MTPREFALASRGFALREWQANRFQAAMTANLMNCQLGRGHRVRVDDLYPPLPGMPDDGKQAWLAQKRKEREENDRKAREEKQQREAAANEKSATPGTEKQAATQR